MINRVFIISGRPEGGFPANVYSSVMASPGVEGSLAAAYSCLEKSPWPMALTVRVPLSPDDIRFVTSFLFMPSYLRINHRPVIILAGDAEPAKSTMDELKTYLEEQGIDNVLIHQVSQDRLFSSVAILSDHYTHLLNTEGFYDNDVFFCPPEGEEVSAALGSLLKAEQDFQERNATLYALARKYLSLEEANRSLERRQELTQTELANQQLYVEMLRSDHQAKEIQDRIQRRVDSTLAARRQRHVDSLARVDHATRSELPD